MNKTWIDLNIKDKIAIISAIAAFSIGWLLTICAAFIQLMLSEQSILWILGQSLVYAASVFGISAYFRNETVQMKSELNNHLEKMERLQIQREKLRNGLDVDEIPKYENEE